MEQYLKGATVKSVEDNGDYIEIVFENDGEQFVLTAEATIYNYDEPQLEVTLARRKIILEKLY